MSSSRRIRFYPCTFCASLLLAFTYFMFGPIEMYFANHTVLWFSTEHIVPVTALAFLIALALLYALAQLAEMWNKGIVATLIFGLGLAVYVQGNFLQIHYGLLDGRDVPWGSYSQYAVVNTIIWIALILTPAVLYIWKPQSVKKIIIFLSLFIVAIQLTTLVTLVLTTKIDNKKEPYYATFDQALSLSKKKNMVVFLLDGFDGGYMDDILKSYPEYKQVFTDFTFYENTTSLYPLTRAAIPHILTGTPYHNEQPYAAYLNESYLNSHLYAELMSRNYNVGLYTDQEMVGETIYPHLVNFKQGEPQIASPTTFAKLLYRFTGVKYLPHILKQYVWMYTGDFDQAKQSDTQDNIYTSSNLDFYDMLTGQGVTTGSASPAFRFFHLYGAHGPAIHDANLQLYPQREEGPLIEQAAGTLKIVQEYIRQLKQLGIYDDTFIVVMSDHGWANLKHHPLLMIKRSNQSHPFTISSLPVSYHDLLDDWLYMITEGTKGISVDEIPAWRESREFLNYVYQTVPGEYLNQMKSLEIAGDVDKHTEVITDSLKTYGDLVYEPIFTLGNKFLFGTRNQYNIIYSQYGLLNAQDETINWSVGRLTGFEFYFSRLPEADLIVEFNYVPFSGKPEMEFFANGVQVEWLDASTDNYLQILIPKEYVTEPKLTLQVRYLNPVSDRRINGEKDYNEYAVGYQTVSIIERPE